MAVSRTSAELETDVRTWGDFVNSGVFTSPILRGYLSAGVGRAYDLMVDAKADFFAKVDDNIYTTKAQGHAVLPDDFYRLLRLDVRDGPNGLWQRLRKFEWAERDWFETHTSEIERLRIFYVPQAPRFTKDSDKFYHFGVREAEELVIQVALRHCYIREQRPLGDVDREIARCEAAIISAGKQRDSQEPRTMSDLETNVHPGLAYRLTDCNEVSIVEYDIT